MPQKRLIAALMLAASALPLGAYAQGVDKQIEGAKQCTKNLARYERQFGIPSHLLSAISATESGRYHKGLQITLPWPWTINVEGEGHYYDSKEEAIAAVRRFKAQGARSVDIGCMQVNLIHHPDAFASLEDAFDPETNVAYGASFLRSLYEESKSWKKAAANYHSRTPERGRDYAGKVYSRWTNIIDRLRDAKASIPESTVAALSEKELPAPPVQLAMAKPAEKNIVNVKPKVVASNTARMNSISVREVNHEERDNGVLVIRPKITVAEEPVQMAAVTAAPIPDMAPLPKVINVAAHQPEVQNGPRFIFDN